MSMNGSPRCRWTQREVVQVRAAFGAAATAEALDLFAPDDWRDLCENLAGGDFTRERDKLRAKAARHRAGAEMGFSPEEIAVAGAKTNAVRDGAA